MTDFTDPFADLSTTKLMLRGVFHFKDRGLDRHKPQHGFDVFEERRQQEEVRQEPPR